MKQNYGAYDNYSSLPFYKLYDISLDFVPEDAIDHQRAPVRLINALHRRGCESICDFLKLSPMDLVQTKGLGKGSIAGADNLARELAIRYGKGSFDSAAKTSDKNISAQVLDNRDKILSGEFDYFDALKLSDEDKDFISQAREAYACCGKVLIDKVRDDKEALKGVISVLENLAQPSIEKGRKQAVLKQAYEAIPSYRRELMVKGFIYAYSCNGDSDDDLLQSKLSDLKRTDDESLNEYYTSVQKTLDNPQLYKKIIGFFKWCSFDLGREIELISYRAFKDERQRAIVLGRAKGETLESIGNEFGVTRERIRQIEAKSQRLFQNYIFSNHILQKIYADRNCDEILTPAELQEYFKADSSWILYLLRETTSSSFAYNDEIDAFVVGNLSIGEQAHDYIDSLPDSFDDSRLESFISAGIEDGLSQEILERGINDQYQHTGKHYHRKKLRIIDICKLVLGKYYPEGLHVYDKGLIKDFRMHAEAEFGDVKLPAGDRALVAIICRAGILCGRGEYKLRQKKYISEELANKVLTYITETNANIFLMNTLFYKFQEELEEEGVGNKYYLQGILKSLYGDRFFFRRDYLCKNEEETSLYNDIIKHIKQSNIPVLKEEVYRRYPGITDIVVSIALSDHSIINLGGKYLHKDNLKFNSRDKRQLEELIDKSLKESGFVHARDLFSIANVKCKDVLRANGILSYYGFYSVIEALFDGKYKFERPYIAKHNLQINRPEEQINEFIHSSEKLAIVDVVEFARGVHARPNNILQFINEFNQDYFLIDNEYIASEEYIGLTGDIIEKLLEKIGSEVNSTMAIRDLQCFTSMPTLNVPWTEWLIYSLLNKYSTNMEVAPSQSNFRRAIPIVAPIGQMNLDKIELRMDFIENLELAQADDLNNIDDLIVDYIEEELQF